MRNSLPSFQRLLAKFRSKTSDSWRQFKRPSARNIMRKPRLVGLLGLILLIYGAGVMFYKGHLLPRTYFANVNVSELNRPAAEQKIKSKLMDMVIDLQENGQQYGSLRLGQLSPEVDASAAIDQALKQQNPFLWPFHLFYKQTIEGAEKAIAYQENSLTELMSKLAINNEQRPAAQDAIMVMDDQQKVSVKAEKHGQQISPASLQTAINQTLNTGSLQVDLKQAYIQPKVKKDSQAMQAQLDAYQNVIQLKITHVFDGNSLTIPQETIQSWVSLDDQGDMIYDQEAIKDYIFNLNEEYTARFQPRQFHSTYQGEVTIQPGTFGWYIDADQESEAIIQILKEGKNIEREPVIVGKGYQMDPTEAIGNSYVEVDLTHQMMLIYQEGKLVLQTPIVSGKIGTETIPGAYQVWNMEQDTNLKGYNPHTQRDYVQPVKYWIAFDNQAQGIHDAIWQSTFGGSAYQQSGSLGCVNTPLDVMSQVYEIVDYGWPVIVF